VLCQSESIRKQHDVAFLVGDFLGLCLVDIVTKQFYDRTLRLVLTFEMMSKLQTRGDGRVDLLAPGVPLKQSHVDIVIAALVSDVGELTSN